MELYSSLDLQKGRIGRALPPGLEDHSSLPEVYQCSMHRPMNLTTTPRSRNCDYAPPLTGEQDAEVKWLLQIPQILGIRTSVEQIKENLHTDGLKKSMATQGAPGPLREPPPQAFPACVVEGDV